MKIRNYFFTALTAVSFMLTSCNNDDITGGMDDSEEATISIKLAGSELSRSQLNLTSAEESKIYNYQVYIFAWESGIVERIVPGNLSKTTTIEKLKTATAKRVVVLANLGEEANYPKVNNYSELEQNKFNLDLQTPELVKNKGYIMSGQSTERVVLNAKEKVEETIKIKRVVAKISLETIKFVPKEGHDINKIEILGVSAQRVAPDVTLAPIKSYYSILEDGYHYGGFETPDTQMRQRDYLVDQLSIDTLPYEEGKPYEIGNYFLVFPNQNEDYCTLLTIKAEYDGEVLYYPIKINYQDGSQDTDGRFIESNKEYKLNLTLRSFGDGTTDPETPGENADLDVTIKVEEWKTIIQNEEW